MLLQHLEKLTHFVGIVRAGSIRKYASLNRLSQPAMSKCLQILETELEASLVVRDQHGVELTQAGELLFRWSERLISETEELGTAIRLHSGLKLRDKLKMGTYQSVAVYFVPKFYKFIQRQQNRLLLEFTTAPSQELMLMLKSGAVDFTISIDPPKAAEFHHVVLFKDFYSLFKLSGTSQLADEIRIFTLPTARDENRRSLKAYLKSAGLLNQLVSCSDFEAVKAMLEGGAGWAILPDRVAASALSSKRIERVTQFPNLQAFGRHSVTFSCRSHRAGDQALQWIANQLQLMLKEEKL
jgi:DNA-binding transcriptional LysR family regulator